MLLSDKTLSLVPARLFSRFFLPGARTNCFLSLFRFQDKTKNRWANRDTFEKVPGKYDLLRMDYAEDEPDAKKLRTEAAEKAPKVVSFHSVLLIRIHVSTSDV